MDKKSKLVIYQVLPRLFGANEEHPKAHESKEENGVGKFADFTGKALNEIRKLGVTHLWLTGVIEHATQTDYTAFGIAPDSPDVVKGRAGSPYAIKDYYDIDPDLANDVPQRTHEFELLVARIHKVGLKLVLDFVPNHVARHYESDAAPKGVRDFGADDDATQAFTPRNNFYYLTGQEFHSPISPQEQTCPPDRRWKECPARATGNDCFSASPSVNDWYETVKLNYGVDYQDGHACHFDPVPDTWPKMLDILLYWADKGADAFRCDMAEMVPCEFWGWAIPQVKSRYPQVLFIAEVYNPQEYRNYIWNGHFDYLYDKVGLYDTLRAVVRGECSATAITARWQSVDDIGERMLNFLENHDEQRLASDFFAGKAAKGRPALLVAALMRTNPVMVYCGQELGERGMDEEGFSGRDGRTTIFDYWTVQTVRRWRHGGRFDDKLLTEEEKALRSYYATVLHLCNDEPAIRLGQFFDLMYANLDNPMMDTHRQFAFLRKHGRDLVLVVANFGECETVANIRMPRHAIDFLQIPPDEYIAKDLLTGTAFDISLKPDSYIQLTLPALGGVVLKVRL